MTPAEHEVLNRIDAKLDQVAVDVALTNQKLDLHIEGHRESASSRRWMITAIISVAAILVAALALPGCLPKHTEAKDMPEITYYLGVGKGFAKVVLNDGVPGDDISYEVDGLDALTLPLEAFVMGGQTTA